MANYTCRDVTTVRREYVLPSPTNWAEVGEPSVLPTRESLTVLQLVAIGLTQE